MDYLLYLLIYEGFLGDLAVKNLPASGGIVGLSPGLGRSPGVGNGNPFQYSCLENPLDRGAYQSIVHRVTKKSEHSFWPTGS